MNDQLFEEKEKNREKAITSFRSILKKKEEQLRSALKGALDWGQLEYINNLVSSISIYRAHLEWYENHWDMIDGH
jgi:hypothetical protein